MEEACLDAVNDDPGAVSVLQKLAKCQTQLTTWSSSKFRGAGKELKKKTKLLEELQRHEGAENWEDILKLQG